MENVPASGTRVTLLGRLRIDPVREKPGLSLSVITVRGSMAGAETVGCSQPLRGHHAKRVIASRRPTPRIFLRSQPQLPRWLKTLTMHALSDYLKGREHPAGQRRQRRALQMLHELEAREDLLKHLQDRVRSGVAGRGEPHALFGCASRHANVGGLPPDGTRGPFRSRCRRTHSDAGGPGLRRPPPRAKDASRRDCPTRRGR